MTRPRGVEFVALSLQFFFDRSSHDGRLGLEKSDLTVERVPLSPGELIPRRDRIELLLELRGSHNGVTLGIP